MSKLFHLTKKPYQVNGASRKIKPSIQLLNVVIIGLVIFGSIGYLIQVNGLVVKSYQIKDLESKIQELKQSQNTLQLQISELESMDNIKNKVSRLNMVAAGQAEYLSATPVALAR